MLTLDSHPSVEEQALDQLAAVALETGRVDPKLLYATPRQAGLWKEVFFKHSPIHGNPGFQRIYREAFARVAGSLRAKRIFLIGLGCGTGMKERELCESLKAHGHEVLFSAIDVSRELALESAQRLVAAGAGHQRSLACDLTQAEFLGQWLNDTGGDLPRLITFFGLFPNFAPSVVARTFRAILRPGDSVLASAHLAPVNSAQGEDLSAAMQRVLPQYDNAETLAWLEAVLDLGDWRGLLDRPEMRIGEVEGVPAFIGAARWKTNAPFEKYGRHFTPDEKKGLLLFSSLRYTPAMFEEVLRREGFAVELLAITSCREEAIWSIRRV